MSTITLCEAVERCRVIFAEAEERRARDRIGGPCADMVEITECWLDAVERRHEAAMRQQLAGPALASLEDTPLLVAQVRHLIAVLRQRQELGDLQDL